MDAISGTVRPIAWLARLIATLVTLVLPAGYYYLAYRGLADALALEAEAMADSVTLHVNTNPQLWQYEKHPLEGILQRSHPEGEARTKKILDQTGGVAAELDLGPAPPLVGRSAAVYDAGIPVGHVEVTGSQRAILIRTGWVLAGSACLGAAVYAVLNLFPLTALRRSLEDLSEERDKAQVTLASIAEAVVTTDPSGRVVLLNGAAEALFGVTGTEGKGRAFGDLCELSAVGSGARWRAPWSRAAPGPQPLRWTLVGRDGGSRSVTVKAGPIRSSSGAEAGHVIVLWDVTEWERMESDLRRSQSLESLGVLAGGIAHDFNNLLTAILGNLEIAGLDEECHPRTRKRLAAASTACERARDLTQQLLTFARGGAPVRKAVNLSQVLRETAEFTSRGSGAALRLDVAPDLWTVEADQGQISRVLQNLVLNAQQAASGAGTILVEASNCEPEGDTGNPVPAGRFVRLSVQDSGPGIPPEEIGRVFDPFYTTKPGGTGLGLPTVHSIVNKHGGRVEVTSSLGQGTRFDVYLPAVDVEAPPPDSVRAAPLRVGGRLLLMDDDDFVREAAAEMFEHLGLEVTATRDGREALERYEEAATAGAPYDLAVFDLTVPGGMGGEEAVARLKERHPEALVIASSGYSEAGAMAGYRERGFDQTLGKPYRLEDVASVLASLEPLRASRRASRS